MAACVAVVCTLVVMVDGVVRGIWGGTAVTELRGVPIVEVDA